MNKKIIPVFFACDDNYIGPLSVSIISLRVNRSRNYRYNIHILTTSLSDRNRNTIVTLSENDFNVSVLDINEHFSKISMNLTLRDYYSYSTYLRFFIADLFPEYDKALYLDSDLSIKSDISKLYETELNDNYIAACADDLIPGNDIIAEYIKTVLDVEPSKYFNAGVLLMNVKRIREDKILERFINYSRIVKYPVAQDQDYLNVLMKDRVSYVSDQWNRMARKDDRYSDEETYIVHYKLSYKPWHYKNVYLEEHFWKYAELSPYYKDLLRQRRNYNSSEKDIEAWQNIINLCHEEIDRAAGREEVYDDYQVYGRRA